MGFLSRKCPISRFRLPEQLSREQLQQTVESLARHGFRSIDTLPDALALGWVNFDDPTDSEWRISAPERLAHFVFTLRQDQRKVPPKLLEVRTRAEIKKFLERRRAELKEKFLIPFANKDEKAEIRARIYASLLSQAAPVPTMTDVVWINPADNKQSEIWLCSTTDNVCEQFTRLFANTFHCATPRPVTPWSPRPDEDTPWPLDPGRLFLTWLYGHDGDSLDVLGADVAVHFERVTVCDNANDLLLTANLGDDSPKEVAKGIEDGLLVREADISLTMGDGDEYLARVRGDDFAMRILPKFWIMDREDPEGSFADKVLSVERLFMTWDRLYRLWLREKGHPINDAVPDSVSMKTRSAVRTGAALAAAGVQSVSKAPGGGVVLEFKNGGRATITTNPQNGREA